MEPSEPPGRPAPKKSAGSIALYEKKSHGSLWASNALIGQHYERPKA
jgi:hypothetical protein